MAIETTTTDILPDASSTEYPVVEDYGLYDAVDTLNCLLLLIGVTGNTLSALVFSSTSLKSAPHSPFMIGLNISDMVYIVARVCFTTVLYRTGLVPFGTRNLTADKIRSYSEKTAGTISLLYIFLFTLQRYVMIQYPHRSVTKKLLEHKKPIALAMPLVVIVLNILPLVFRRPGRTVVKISLIVCLRFIPGLILFILNFLIIGTLRRRRMRKTSTTSVSDDDCFRRVTIMLLTISMAFFILNAPSSAFYFYTKAKGFRTPSRRFPGCAPEYINIMSIVFRSIHNLNYVSNFFLYCATASNFRKALCDFKKKTTAYPSQIREMLTMNNFSSKNISSTFMGN